MKLKVKICGMREPQNIREVAALNPEYMGFIFYDKSPRYVGTDFEIPLIESKIKKVGVFVNASHEVIVQQVHKYNLSCVQLHGQESPELCSKLRLEGITVIKVFLIDQLFEFNSLLPYEERVDFFLFDTKGNTYGGTGKPFDWSLLDAYSSSIPFFLSGGLNPDNLHQLSSIKSKNLFAVDLNSGVEKSPGIKDIAKLEKVFSELNRALKV